MARRPTRPDTTKERFWRRLLQQWRRSGLTIREFCADHEVSEPSFYAWRRTLAQLDERSAGSARPVPSDAKPPVFVPLRVVPEPAGMALEVVLGPGRLIRVPAGFDPATLRQLLAILEEGPSC
jgi:transposase